MNKPSKSGISGISEDKLLNNILIGTSPVTGERFFRALVENLVQALCTNGAWLTEYLSDDRHLRALAFLWKGEWIENYECPIDGTVCETVIDERRLIYHPDKLGEENFKSDLDLGSYLGVPLLDTDGKCLGNLAVFDEDSITANAKLIAVFKIFAARATAELQRLQAEKEARRERKKLARLINSTMDAILELDDKLRIVRINPAAEKIFGKTKDKVIGQNISAFITRHCHSKLKNATKGLSSLPKEQRSLWIPGNLLVQGQNNNELPAEATISGFEMDESTFYTLILRNVNDRREAEQKIRMLTEEAQYLREEIEQLQNYNDIIGTSPPLMEALTQIEQVAETDATVLLQGETGTGKEAFARAIHNASRRKGKALISVNCATIPAALIESELFGHEKGAFTGATIKRIGRFALADGGTIFLDEIGELPIDMQAKLLRVLQEMEFEPVGSSKTRKVDVRVIAATNRDLRKEIEEGNFREDLYFRLNVFPIKLPPLRKRGDDITLLADYFIKKYARTIGRSVKPFTRDQLQRLKKYSWPGNIRELQNIIERAVITSENGYINLDYCLPDHSKSLKSNREKSIEPVTGKPVDQKILSIREMEQLERDNYLRALESTGWRVSGKKGAARLLGINPSTLNSRMKALGIKRPGD